jgi:hypothetical protein
LETLEDRRLLATDDWRTVVDVAPLNFAVGDFTLSSSDWSGKAEGGRVMASGFALGIESTGEDEDAGGFQPGEFWSFRFDRPGRLMGIHFDGFTLEDADKALLTIGDAEPIVVDAERVKGGFWRPDRLLEFASGETLRLVAADPVPSDLKRAEEAYNARISTLADTTIGPPTPFHAESQWKVRGLNVIGLADTTFGGYVNFAHREPTTSVAFAAAVPDGYRPAASRPLSGPDDGSATIGFGAAVADVDLQYFKVDSDASKFKFTYVVTDGPLGVSSFNIRVYRSADGVTPNGGALAVYNVTGVASGTYNPTFNVDLGNDVQEDYYLLAVAEDAGDVTTNNKKEFYGGAFRDVATDVAYYHAETKTASTDRTTTATETISSAGLATTQFSAAPAVTTCMETTTTIFSTAERTSTRSMAAMGTTNYWAATTMTSPVECWVPTRSLVARGTTRSVEMTVRMLSMAKKVMTS